MQRRSLALALTTLALAHAPRAQDRVLPYPVTEPASYRAAIQAGTRSESGAPGQQYWTDHIRHVIDATLDPAAATVSGAITVTYENRSPVATNELWFHLHQNLHLADAMRTRVVEPTAGMTIADLTVNGRPVRARPDGTRMRVALRGEGLEDGLAPGKSVTVAMRFAYPVPKAGTAPRNGHEDHHVFYLGYWYPQVAVRDDVDGWVCEEYRGNGEFYLPYASYDVTLRAPAGFLVRATGVLQDPQAILHDSALEALARAKTTRDVQAVISALDLAAGRVTRATEGLVAWRFLADDVRDCAVSASDRYVWDVTHAVVPGRDQPAEIHAVYEPSSRSWPEAAAIARHAIEWMSQQVHPYPWPHMTACEGIIGGGMEFPMMTLIGDAPNPQRLQGVVSHELIHMWFPMLAGSNEKRHAWQDEGTTSFFTDLCTADLRDTPNNSRGSMLGYVRTARSGQESPMMTHADFYPVGYGFASYGKPAALLHQLRAILRDGERDVLMEAIRTYASEWAFKHPSPYDLFRTIERVAGRDLDWYWQPWYFEVRTLDRTLASVTPTDDQLAVVIEDKGFVPLPCTVRATYPDKEPVTRVIPVEHWLARNTTATLVFPAGAQEIRIDPDGDTLEIDRTGDVWKADR
ncbi:MAG: M1 family metallopeptidase [Planctomycetes bacterium]|nr:M1 family metallopeptidase [Planctomycetota bacterium]